MLLKKRTFKATLPGGELNIVSFMDVLTTLLFFLLIAASFSHLSVVTGMGIPTLSATSSEDNRPRFTLEVVIHNPKNATVWLAPYTGLKIMQQSELERYLKSAFKGDNEIGFMKKIQSTDLKSLLSTVQDTLIPIKRSFPNEMGAVVAIADQIPYQNVVDTLTALSSLDGKKKKAFEVTDVMGQRSMTTVLFPQVIISEWSEEKEKQAGA